MVSYKNWILIINENQVWAGYHEPSQTVYGEYEWENLPFTVYISGGILLGEKKFSEQKSSAPAGWERREQTR